MTGHRDNRPTPASSSGDAATGCPDAAVLSAFVDRLLPETDRARVAEHLSRCDDCHHVVRETVLALAGDAVEPPSDRRATAWLRRWEPITRWGYAAAVMIAVAGGATLAHRQGWFLSSAERASAELVAAVGPRRLIEPRLSGGFRFGPLESPERGDRTQQVSRLLDAVTLVTNRHSENPNIENTRALAAGHVLVGRLDVGVRVLEALVASHPEDAYSWNDLAAARLVRATPERGDVAAALEEATRALELMPDMPEALYNRALALHTLNLHAPAREACQRLLDLDHSSWRAAAQALLEAIDAKARQSDAQTSVESDRLRFEAQLEKLAGPQDVAQIAAMGALFRVRTGDRYIAAVAEELSAAPEALAVYVSFAAARRDYVERRWARARTGFAGVLPLLQAKHSVLAPWTRLHLSILDYQTGGVKAVNGAFESLLEEARDQPLLEARVHWMLGLCDVASGRFDAAERQFRAAEELFTATGDVPHAAFMSLERSEVLDYLGRHDLAWSARLMALKQLDSFPDFRRQITLLHASAARATDSRAPRAALAFIAHARAILSAQGSGDDPELGLEQARAELAMGLPQAGTTLLEQESRIQREEDGLRRDRLLGEFYRVASEFPSVEGDVHIREAMDRGIAWMESRAESAREAPLLVHRGAAVLRAGAPAVARRDFERAVHLLARESESDFEMRLSRMRLGSEALERLVEIGLAEGASDLQLLALADRRWHLAADGEIGRTSVDDVRRLVSRLDPQVALVGVLPLEHEIVSWCVTSQGVARERLGIPRKQLAKLAAGEEPALLSRLLSPHAERLASRARMLLVASGSLGGARWGRLQSPGSLPSLPAIALVPSLEFVLQRGGSQYGAPRDVLAIAAPGSDGLPFLSRARQEAEVVVRALGHGRVLTDGALKRESVLEVLREAGAFHFAGHALANLERPSLSRLVLAPHGNDLLVRDIRAQDLRNLSIVTLSACSAAADESSFGEGGLSLAAAFLQGGATTVIASRDDIRDEDASRIMGELYQRLAHQNPVRALSEMQKASEGSGAVAALVVFTAAGALARAPRQSTGERYARQ